MIVIWNVKGTISTCAHFNSHFLILVIQLPPHDQQQLEIVKNVVSFAHAQVDFALILAPSAYNQYDKIDK